MRWALLALVLAGGCAPVISGEPKPGQEEALGVIFTALGESPRFIPVNWNANLDCDEGQGFTIATGECANATTEVDVRSRPVHIIVADRDPTPWDSLAHEVCHWTKGDHEHAGPCNDAGPLLTYAREMLAATPR
jgi:hypothetical protein